MYRVPVLSAMAATVLGSAAASQTTTRLTRPEAEFPEPFTQITALRELPGGKVLVSDRADKVVQLIDFASGSATKVGREGQGPGEYALPSALLPLPGGKTLLQDLLTRRFLEIGPDGKPGGTLSLPAVGGGPAGGIVIGIGSTLGDSKGNIYLQSPPFNPQNPEVQLDSVAILRWDRVKPGFDTVAWVGVPKANVQARGGGGELRVQVGMARVFEPQEAWGVAGDGSIARVTPSPYRVYWYPAAGGRPAAGPEVPWTPIRVTEADKKAAEEARRRARPLMVAFGPGGRQAAPPAAPLSELSFADTKPPFSGPNSVLVAPEGEVWVEKNQPAGTANPLYDVFDRTGILVRKVTLNPRSRVVGFGAGTVYVMRMDDDDLQYLERYAR